VLVDRLFFPFKPKRNRAQKLKKALLGLKWV